MSGSDCDSAAAYTVPVGLLTIDGLYNTDDSCTLEDDCASVSFGVGLLDGDRVMLKLESCSDGRAVPGLTRGGVSLGAREEGSVYKFGVFNISAMPITYRKCWCRAVQTTDCLYPHQFLADSGTLTLACPAGYFSTGAMCKLCTRGFFCLGQTSPKQACALGQATIEAGATRVDDCLCKPGYELEVRCHFHGKRSRSQ